MLIGPLSSAPSCLFYAKVLGYQDIKMHVTNAKPQYHYLSELPSAAAKEALSRVSRGARLAGHHVAMSLFFFIVAITAS
jgi:hypothetical protein